jgi:hypothetical protein
MSELLRHTLYASNENPCGKSIKPPLIRELSLSEYDRTYQKGYNMLINIKIIKAVFTVSNRRSAGFNFFMEQAPSN